MDGLRGFPDNQGSQDLENEFKVKKDELVAKFNNLSLEDLAKLEENGLIGLPDPEIFHAITEITRLAEKVSRGSPFRSITPEGVALNFIRSSPLLERVQNIFHKQVHSKEELKDLCQELESLDVTPYSDLEAPLIEESEKDSIVVVTPASQILEKTPSNPYSDMVLEKIGVKGQYYEELVQDKEKQMEFFTEHYKTMSELCFDLNVDGETIVFQGGVISLDGDGLSSGVGGFGRVFLGKNALGEDLAVKISEPKQSPITKKWVFTREDQEREAELLIRMNGAEYVAGAVQVGFIGKFMFTVMKKADGIELFDRVGEEISHHQELIKAKALSVDARNEKYPIPQKIQTLIDIAKGLKELHQAGIVHRDLKMENVMVEQNGHAKIIDLGLARYIHEKVTLRSCTPIAASPETLFGEEQEAPSDVYSFGLLMDSLLSGQTYLTQEGVRKRKFIQEEGSIVQSYRRYEYFFGRVQHMNMKYKIAEIVNRCLEFSPIDRITVDDLIHELETLEQILK